MNERPMVGPVRGIYRHTGDCPEDTQRYADALPLSEEACQAIFAGTARRVPLRLAVELKARGL
jgi:hypothetical protein